MRKTVTLDSKRRATFPKPFQPGDTFVVDDSGGGIVFRKVEAVKPKEIKLRKQRGQWVADLGMSPEEIRAAIRADRDSR